MEEMIRTALSEKSVVGVDVYVQRHCPLNESAERTPKLKECTGGGSRVQGCRPCSVRFGSV